MGRVQLIRAVTISGNVVKSVAEQNICNSVCKPASVTGHCAVQRLHIRHDPSDVTEGSQGVQ